MENIESTTKELFEQFDSMHGKCMNQILELNQKYNIRVVSDDNSFFQVAWPVSDGKKVCSKIVAQNFGGAFRTIGDIKPASKGMELAVKYIKQVEYTKKYGKLLISYAQLVDKINEGEKTFIPDKFDAFVKVMKDLFELANSEKKKKKK